jgi:hypothetical protein
MRLTHKIGKSFRSHSFRQGRHGGIAGNVHSGKLQKINFNRVDFRETVFIII